MTLSAVLKQGGQQSHDGLEQVISPLSIGGRKPSSCCLTFFPILPIVPKQAVGGGKPRSQSHNRKK